MRGAFAIGVLLLAGCAAPGPLVHLGEEDALRPLTQDIPRPRLALGTWWQVETHRDAQGSSEEEDTAGVYWVVGHLERDGAKWPLVLGLPFVPDDGWPARPFSLELLAPGESYGAYGGVQSQPFHAFAADCRGNMPCLQNASLEASDWQIGGPLHFPLGPDHDRPWERGDRCNRAGHQHALGWTQRDTAMGRLDVVRVTVERDCGRTVCTTFDYAPSLGLVVHREQDGATGGWADSTTFTRDVTFVGHRDPPPLSAIAAAFEEAQVARVQAVSLTLRGADETGRLTLRLGENATLDGAMLGMMPGDEVVVSWTRPFGTEALGNSTLGAPWTPPGVGDFWPAVQVVTPQGRVLGQSQYGYTVHVTWSGNVTLSCDGTTCTGGGFPGGPGISRVSVAWTSQPPAPWDLGTAYLRGGDVWWAADDCFCGMEAAFDGEAPEGDWAVEYVPDAVAFATFGAQVTVA